MIVGVPKEVKDHETRVGLVPSGVTALCEAGHEVLVQSTAGAGSVLTDGEYIEAGAVILPTAAEVWRRADLEYPVGRSRVGAAVLRDRKLRTGL